MKLSTPCDIKGLKGIPLSPHLLCRQFPALSDADFDALAEDIKQHGVQEPIVIYNEFILDGYHRFKAYSVLLSEEVRVPLKYVVFEGNEEEASAFVESANLYRRHLSPELKAMYIRRAIARKPHVSNRQIARETSSSPTTVAKLRDEMEEVGDVSSVDTRTDTQGRQQPASKRKPVDPSASGIQGFFDDEGEIAFVPPAVAPAPEPSAELRGYYQALLDLSEAERAVRKAALSLPADVTGRDVFDSQVERALMVIESLKSFVSACFEKPPDPVETEISAITVIPELTSSLGFRLGQWVKVKGGDFKGFGGQIVQFMNWNAEVQFKPFHPDGLTSAWIGESLLQPDFGEEPRDRICETCGLTEATHGLYCETCDPAADIVPVDTTYAFSFQRKDGCRWSE